MSNGLDLSGALEKLQNMLSTTEGQEQIQDMISAFGGSLENENPISADSGSAEASAAVREMTEHKPQSGSDIGFSDMITPDMLFKIQKIMTLLNKNKSEKGAELLRCLKPFLKQSRREKVDKAVKLITLMRVFEILKREGGI